MKQSNFNLKAVFISAAILTSISISTAYSAPATSVHFTSKGELIQPKDYREWVHVGTQVTPNDMNDGKAAIHGFHNVYVDPESFAYWKKTGEFRDGTVVIKELLDIGTKNALTGNGYFMGNYTGLEAAIKDSKRFPNEPGNWAYFMFGTKYPLPQTTAAQPTAECNTCHEKNAQDDWVFTQYYPTLTAAKPKDKVD
ncbi:cytochrome P460 family protein [Candidatus Nitrosacidococcus tergens]|uniref:Cytochrome P460 n=1 Tax=Candidatus Nitrosacidococcus tergens TaxID=553981 RepID=A0A7G1QAZ8_9GAMM|nr:cytochrome P460 family protein [Candidatus Nitrosacidococcus tergens]CAB1276352.1 Putative Cytochrome P460 [Candidatus Nitrosacidococcus tergens]